MQLIHSLSDTEILSHIKLFDITAFSRMSLIRNKTVSGSSAGFSLTVKCLNRAHIPIRVHQFCFARRWQMIKNIRVLSSYTGTQERIQKTKQCTTPNQRLPNKENTIAIPLCTGIRGHSQYQWETPLLHLRLRFDRTDKETSFYAAKIGL